MLAVPLHAQDHAVFFRLNQLMQPHGWEPTRISGVSSSADTRVATNGIPTAYPPISKEFLGEVDTTTPYVIGKIVSRLEMDSRWALARSVRALAAERDALQETLEGNSSP